MCEGHSAEEQGQLRKNSILVKDEHGVGRSNLHTAHPHFVESIVPHRSSSVSVHDQPGPVHLQPSSSGSSPGSHGVPTPSYNNADVPGGPNSELGAGCSHERLNKVLVNASSGQSKDTSVSVGSAHSAASLAQVQADAQFSNFSSVRTSGSGHFSAAADANAATVTQSNPPRVKSPTGHASDNENSGHVSGRTASKVPSDPRIPMDDGKIHILIGITGSLHISSVKSIIMKLQSIYGDRVAIQVIVTPAAEKIVASTSNSAKEAAYAHANHSSSGQPASVNVVGSHPTGHHPNLRDKNSQPNLRIWHDCDEWDTWRGRNDPIIHIELRRWADILLIAPLSANTLGKIAMGLCDNLLTNVVRAWNAQYPILIAPAMVTYAYNHPATKQHLKIIREEMKWIEILRPTEKVVGSTGGIGMGGMMPWNEIVDRVVNKLGGYPEEDDEEEEEEEEEEGSTGRNSSKSHKQGEDEEDEDDEDDEDDDNSILNEIDHFHAKIPPVGSPI